MGNRACPLDRAVIRTVCPARSAECPSNDGVELPPFAKADKYDYVRLVEHARNVALSLQMRRAAMPEVLARSPEQLEKSGRVLQLTM